MRAVGPLKLADGHLSGLYACLQMSSTRDARLTMKKKKPVKKKDRERERERERRDER